MGKLNIEATTGMTPEQLGLQSNTDFCVDEKGVVIGIITSAGGFDYDSGEGPLCDLPTIIEEVNEEKGEAE